MKATTWVLDVADSQGHTIRVERDSVHSASVKIGWGCSTHYFADPAEMVSNMEKVKSQPDVWLVLRTTTDAARYVRIEGGRLYADPDNPREGAVSCDYEDFKAALLAAAANSNDEEGTG